MSFRSGTNYKSYRIPEKNFHENRWAALPLAEQATWVSYDQPAGYKGPAKIMGWNWIEDFSETIAPIGERQWQHSYQLSLYEAGSNTVFMIRANGNKIELNLQADGITYSPSNPNGEQLLKILDTNNVHTGWQYTSRSGILESYGVLGKLLSFSNAQGLTQTLAYDVNNNLISVTDASERILQLSYDSNGRLSALTRPDGELVQFNYDVIGNLKSVVYPDDTPADQTNNPTVVYQYLDSRHPYALTGQVDENGDQYATWTFDAAGRATSSVNNCSRRRFHHTFCRFKRRTIWYDLTGFPSLPSYKKSTQPL